MEADLDRTTLIERLNGLGAEDDASALDAARAAHELVTAAGTSWEDLITPATPEDVADVDAEEEDDADEVDDAESTADDIADDDGDASDDDGDASDDAEDVAKPAAKTGKGGPKSNAESLRIIGRLLAQAADDAELREELEGYREDIAADEFDDRDRQYLKDLQARLKK